MRSNTVKYGLIDIQGREVDSRGEIGVETLSETLADSQLQGDDGILHVGQEHLCNHVWSINSVSVCVCVCVYAWTVRVCMCVRVCDLSV